MEVSGILTVRPLYSCILFSILLEPTHGHTAGLQPGVTTLYSVHTLLSVVTNEVLLIVISVDLTRDFRINFRYVLSCLLSDAS